MGKSKENKDKENKGRDTKKRSPLPYRPDVVR